LSRSKMLGPILSSGSSNVPILGVPVKLGRCWVLVLYIFIMIPGDGPCMIRRGRRLATDASQDGSADCGTFAAAAANWAAPTLAAVS
jgi:hypothetical protein